MANISVKCASEVPLTMPMPESAVVVQGYKTSRTTTEASIQASRFQNPSEPLHNPSFHFMLRSPNPKP